MVKPKKDKVATEAYVWRVFNSLENKIDKKFEETEKKDERRFNKLMEHLVDLAGKFKKFDEEQTVLSKRSSDHEDRIEDLERVVYKTS